jgi:hypothetical protein
MRSFGKRLFTPACKTIRPRMSADFDTLRFGFCRTAIFFVRGGGPFLQGSLKKRVF